MHTASKNNTRFHFLLFLLAMAVCWYIGQHFSVDAQEIQNILLQINPFYSGIIFVFLYVIITFFFLFSKDVFWVMGAVLFGPFLSTLLIWIAEVINAFVLFYFARKLGRVFVEQKTAGRLAGLDERLGKLSLVWLFLLRAVPLIPYRFLDLSAGLTSIPFRKYVLAVILGSPVKTLWVQYVLAGVGQGVLHNPGLIVDYFMGNKVLLAVSLLYPVLAALVIIKIRKRV